MSDETGISWTEATWNPVPGFPGYDVSDDGQIRRSSSGRVLALQKRETGHLFVQLRIGGRSRKLYVHAAMLLAFVGPPSPGYEARHLDGDPAHNRLSNLVWGTRQENVADRVRHGRQQRGQDLPHAKLNPEAVHAIRAARGVSCRELGRRFGVSHTTILKVIRGERWAHVG